MNVKTLRIVGFLEGWSFLLLLFIAMPMKYIWDNRNSRWVVDTDLMVWMLKQDWFNLNEVDFF